MSPSQFFQTLIGEKRWQPWKGLFGRLKHLVKRANFKCDSERQINQQEEEILRPSNATLAPPRHIWKQVQHTWDINATELLDCIISRLGSTNDNKNQLGLVRNYCCLQSLLVRGFSVVPQWISESTNWWFSVPAIEANNHSPEAFLKTQLRLLHVSSVCTMLPHRLLVLSEFARWF